MKYLICRTGVCKLFADLLPGLFGWLITLSVSTVAGFALFSSWQTFRTHEPQLVSDGDQVWVRKVDHQMLIEYRRDIHIVSNFRGTISRTVYCNNGWSHDMPQAMREFKAGRTLAGRSIDVPFLVPIGTPCRVETMITWKPFMSLIDHTFKVRSIPFIASESAVGGPPKVDPRDEHDHSHANPDLVKP